MDVTDAPTYAHSLFRQAMYGKAVNVTDSTPVQQRLKEATLKKNHMSRNLLLSCKGNNAHYQVLLISFPTVTVTHLQQNVTRKARSKMCIYTTGHMAKSTQEQRRAFVDLLLRPRASS